MLLVTNEAAHTEWIVRALEPTPVVTVADVGQAQARVVEGTIDLVLCSPRLPDIEASIDFLQSLSMLTRPIPVAFVAQREQLPQLILAKRLEFPVLSLSASPSRFRRSVQKILGSPATEMTIGAPSNDGQALVLRTVRKAARVPGAVIRQSNSAGTQAVQVVLPHGPRADEFQHSLQDDWGLALRANDASEHPVVKHLNGLTGSQQVFVVALNKTRWAYAAFLPWKKSPKTTMLAGIVSLVDETTSVKVLAVSAQQLAVGESSRLGVPAVKLTPGKAVVVPEYDWIATPSYVGPDRRKKPTPMFSRYLFFGRRTVLVEGGVRRPEGFIDRNSHWVLKYFIAYLVLSGIDTTLTYIFVRSGQVQELNPLLKPLVFDYPLAFFVVKNLLSVAAFGLVARFEKFNFGVPLLLALLATYLLLDGYWVLLLTR